MQALLGHALEHYVLYAVFLAEFAFIFIAAILIHYKDIRAQHLYRRHEIHNSTPLIDKGILYISDALYHEQTFLLAVDSLVMLIPLDCLIGANSNIQIPVLRGLAEKFHVTAVQKVVTT